MIFDCAVFTVFLLAQWRISVQLLEGMGRRFSGAWQRAARSAIFVFEGFVAFGYLCSFSDLVSRIGIPPQFAMILGACTVVYLALSAGVLAVWFLLRPVRHWIDRGADRGRRQALHTMGNLFLAAPFVAMGYGFVNRKDFHVREVDIPVVGLAKDLEGLRILQLSDIHLSPFLSEADLERVIDACMGLHPNLAVITGDLISHRDDPLDACIRQLARLRADAGVFGCMGNHERYAKVEDYAEQAAGKVGIRFLRDAAVPLRFGAATLNLAGVDHQSTAGGKRYLPGAERLIAPGACNLLLSHNPDVFPVAERQGYNCVLSGHTHGGQVTVEILDQAINPARFFTPYVYGLYRGTTASVYVTRGIGTIVMPARIGAPPEISLLRLRKA